MDVLVAVSGKGVQPVPDSKTIRLRNADSQFRRSLSRNPKQSAELSAQVPTPPAPR
jgi:hypothetical protein